MMLIVTDKGKVDSGALRRTGRHLAESGDALLAQIRLWQSEPEKDIRGSVAAALRLVFDDLRDSYAEVRCEYRRRRFGDLDAELGGGFPPLPARMLN
ncbi:MAG: hypothetical protein K5872_23015 [Rhizobiaceae bacterium]|nr:hypothetical protein [Rhizobiaceae bacterium]MCV0409091.1 hypothetical protein [Rhizobiaceae bacterium]